MLGGPGGISSPTMWNRDGGALSILPRNVMGSCLVSYYWKSQEK